MNILAGIRLRASLTGSQNDPDAGKRNDDTGMKTMTHGIKPFE
jgi:hypothetical protein